MIARIGLSVVLVCLLTACGSSQMVSRQMEKAPEVPAKFRVAALEDHSGSAVPAQFLAAVKGYLEADLTKRNLLGAESEPASMVKVDVNRYRMRSGITRMMFGFMAGKDGLGSKVTVTAPSGAVIGETTVSTFNVMAVGGENDIARMHATEIAKFLVGENVK